MHIDHDKHVEVFRIIIEFKHIDIQLCIAHYGAIGTTLREGNWAGSGPRAIRPWLLVLVAWGMAVVVVRHWAIRVIPVLVGHLIAARLLAQSNSLVNLNSAMR